MTGAKLPQGYSVRSATMADADPAMDLFNTCEMQEVGEPDYTPGEFKEEWSTLNLGERVTFVQASDGSLAGSLTLKSRGNIGHEADIYVHPEHTGRGIGNYLVLLSEARAESWLESAPRGIR